MSGPYKEITMRWKKDEIEYLITHVGKMKLGTGGRCETINTKKL